MDAKIRKHIETLNREMGIVQTDVRWLKECVEEIKKDMNTLKILVMSSILLPIALFILEKWLSGGG